MESSDTSHRPDTTNAINLLKCCETQLDYMLAQVQVSSFGPFTWNKHKASVPWDQGVIGGFPWKPAVQWTADQAPANVVAQLV